MKLTRDSKIKDLYKTAIGQDVVDKILMQMNKSHQWITNPLVSNLKISALNLYIKDEGFLDALLDLINSETELGVQEGGTLTKQWWKEVVFYQIYPRSFKDSNGDGLGDLQGIISKLDYLKELGIGGLWLSPIFKSPMKDNGYDISDYYDVNPEMGTMDDLKELIDQAHKRDIRVIMDLVVNHTSDEHPWFQEALHDPNSDKRDYYFFRKKEETNNWVSFFFESAWRYFKEQDIYALKLFAKEQIDLNWDNPKVRDEVVKIINFYGDLGIDGLRLDVINYISKKEGLPQGNQWVGDLMEFTGIEHYFYGPHLNEYLAEINSRGFAPNHMFSIGETPGIGIQLGKLLSADYRKQLDLLFTFDHLETPGHVRFDEYLYDLNFYKEHMMKVLGSNSLHDWTSLFFENHDNPRMISKVNPDSMVHDVLGKALNVILLTLQGTPFIYQGQEAGFINQEFTEEDLRDVESINKLKVSDMKTVLAGTRDHARTTMKWSDEGGFSESEGWIKSQHESVASIESQLEDSMSVLSFTKQLISFRNNTDDLIYAPIQFIHPKTRNYFAYKRGDYFIEINLSDKDINRPKSNDVLGLLLSNYKGQVLGSLRPYEANIYRIL
jgi:oligo-1,6-glucosidase